MDLAKFAADLAGYKSDLDQWEKTDLARARQRGKQLLIRREILIEQAPAYGANKRAVAKDLERPDIGEPLRSDLDEGDPVDQPPAPTVEQTGAAIVRHEEKAAE